MPLIKNMRTGVLSDAAIRRDNPAFFPQLFHVHEASKPKGRKLTGRATKKPLIPFYDLYEIAQRTMTNPYDGASRIVEAYVPTAPIPLAIDPDDATSRGSSRDPCRVEVYFYLGLPRASSS